MTPALPASAPPAPRADRGVAVLLGCGLALVALYLAAMLRIPLWRYFPGEDRLALDFVKMLGTDAGVVTALYVAFVLAAFALYALALAVAWRRARPIPRLVLFGFPALFALALIPMYPPTAVDLIHYHHSSRVLWIFGENPLVTPPETFSYPVRHYWSFQPSPYGPLWSVLGGFATWPAGGHWIAGIMGFKVIAALSLLGCAYLAERIAERLRPGAGDLAVVLLAWNPYVLLRVVGNGHNDLTMMVFVLAAIVFVLDGRYRWAFVALAAAVLVKFVALLLVPLFAVYVWQHARGSMSARFLEAGLCLLLFAGVVVVGFAPFWAGPETLATVREEGSKLITSTAVAISAWRAGGEDPELTRAILLWLRVAFVVVAAVAWWHARRSVEALVAASFVVLFLYLVLAAGWYRPWYMLWPVTIAALRPRSWLAPVLLAITLFGSFPDLVEQYRNGWAFLGTYRVRVLAPVAVAFVPPLLVWAAVAARGLWPDGRERMPAPEPQRAVEA